MIGYDHRLRHGWVTALGYMVARVVFFGGVVALCLYVRASETDPGNRAVLLALALLMASVGVFMVGSALYGAVRGFRPDRLRGQ